MKFKRNTPPQKQSHSRDISNPTLMAAALTVKYSYKHTFFFGSALNEYEPTFSPKFMYIVPLASPLSTLKSVLAASSGSNPLVKKENVLSTCPSKAPDAVARHRMGASSQDRLDCTRVVRCARRVILDVIERRQRRAKDMSQVAGPRPPQLALGLCAESALCAEGWFHASQTVTTRFSRK